MTQFSLAQTNTVVLDGTYDMHLNINGQIFNDIFILKGKDQNIDLANYNAPIEGSIEVVNVFTSPLEGGATCSQLYASCQFQFTIVAHENGQNFNVYYFGSIEQPDYTDILQMKILPTIKGQAYLDNNQLLGDFTAVKRKAD